MPAPREYDIALSFAGEDRDYVEQVAVLLQSSGVTVFYDMFEEATLWGKNLYDYLSDVYQNKAQYTIMFISSAYARKLWTTHERQAMQARAFQESQEYVLPARFDDTPIPGVLPTIGYISLKQRTPQDFVKLVHKKLVQSGRTVPSSAVRGAVYSVVPRASAEPTEARVRVVDSDGNPILAATVVAIAENNTFKEGTSRGEGIATLWFETRRLYRLLVAHPDFPAVVVPSWDPGDELRVVVPISENTGSVVCQSTGFIPGLDGRLNPILDAQGRCYIYADNIAIRGGEVQPAKFSIGEPFALEDSRGVVMQVNVLHIQGRTSLLEFNYARRSDG
jgi:hypothetical protein